MRDQSVISIVLNWVGLVEPVLFTRGLPAFVNEWKNLIDVFLISLISGAFELKIGFKFHRD